MPATTRTNMARITYKSITNRPSKMACNAARVGPRGIPGPNHGSTVEAGCQFQCQAVVEFVQALDVHLGLSQDRHEIRVADPPRDDMPMEMTGKAGACGFPLIQPDI